ncbi:MAG: hypothetical protein ACK2U2_07775 [Anaerolineae bacterium]|jgi:hypothetical protein
MRILFGLLSVAALVLSGCAQLEQSQAAPIAWDSPLPHSAKGYELYSWPIQDGQQWQYVLITGTNRLKTYEEIVPAENLTSESGWVRISATGTEELESLLGQLPPGESVTWIGGDWLEQTGSLRGTIRLPDQDVIDEIERHCRQLGVELSVAP